MDSKTRSSLIILSCISILSCEVVQIKDGLLEGTLMKTRKGLNVYAFLKIPYAESPIGELRFQPPIPNQKWDGILNATEFGPACMQNANGLTMSEDCLHLNVFTKDLSQTALKPVIVYIHYGVSNADFMNFLIKNIPTGFRIWIFCLWMLSWLSS